MVANEKRVRSITLFGVLLFLLGVSLAFAEIRINGSGFMWMSTDMYGDNIIGGPRISEVIGLLLILLGVPRFLRTRHFGRLDALAVIVVLIALLIGSPLFRDEPSGWDVFRAGFLIPLALFLVLRSRRSLRDAAFMATGLIVGALVGACIHVLQALHLLEAGTHVNLTAVGLSTRYYGFGQDTSYQSLYLMTGVCLLSAMLTTMRLKWWSRLLFIVVDLAVVIGTLLTFSITSLLAMAISFFALIQRSSRKSKLGLIAITISALAIGALLLPDLATEVSFRFGSKFANNDRVGPYQAALETLAAFPLFGVGFKNYLTSALSVGIIAPAHTQNMFLAGFVYMGILGGSATLWLLTSTWLRVQSIARRYTTGLEAALCTGVFLVAVVYFINGMTEEVFFSAQAQLAFWPLVGLISGWAESQSSVEQEPKSPFNKVAATRLGLRKQAYASGGDVG